MFRLGLALALLASCISSAKQAIAPEPEGGGTLTCRQVVELCDSQCSDPLCLHQCTPQGLPDARAQHDALLECGQSHGCTDQDCLQASCATEITACMGTEQTPEQDPASTPAPAETPASPSS